MNLLRFITTQKTVNSSRAISIGLIFIVQMALSPLLYSQKVDTPIDSSKVSKDAPGKSKENVLLFPQMTIEQRDAIKVPVTGMVIYNTVARKPQYFDGAAWKSFDASEHFLGEEFGGGIVFFIDESGNHGLVAASDDLQTSAKWGFFENPAGANGKTIGTGKLNTEKIRKLSPKPDNAASLCSELQQNGFSDWFLPSVDELTLMYKNLKLKGLGNFTEDEYWSSSETDFNNSWLMNFKSGYVTESNVNKSIHVRAVRQF